MEKEPLLPHINPRRPHPSPPPPLSPLSPLCPLPEDNEISLPLSLTPKEFKDRLIFGPSSSSPPSSSSSSSPKNSSPTLLDALTLNSPKPSASESIKINPDPQSNRPWLIDPNYQWTKSNLHRAKTAPAMIGDFHQKLGPKKPPQFDTSSIVRQGFVLLILYFTFGVIIYSLNRNNFRGIKTHPVVDALYFCIVTMCTIGYGDITPNSTATKLFSIMFVLVGFGFIDILLNGMVSYVLDLQESHLLKTVKRQRDGDKLERDLDKRGSYIIDVKKGRMRIRMKVALALGVVVLCIGVGAVVMHFVESLGWLDSLYLSVMSVTTVGYGDQAFTSLLGRLFASIWLFVSTLAVARAFLYLAEARVDKRQRRTAKWVLGQDMTVSQFLAADTDNDGFVSKSEYVIYKLKELKKVSEKDISQICKKFDRLDTGNSGKITLGDLMESHH